MLGFKRVVAHVNIAEMFVSLDQDLQDQTAIRMPTTLQSLTSNPECMVV